MPLLTAAAAAAATVAASGWLLLLHAAGWAWSEIREPRVAPFASNVLYYLLLLVSAVDAQLQLLLVAQSSGSL
jgi:prepilin signal peptidase PulO-like enzyme (type II secretory pathway)